MKAAGVGPLVIVHDGLFRGVATMEDFLSLGAILETTHY